MRNKLLATLAMLTVIATFMFSASAVSAGHGNYAYADSNGSFGHLEAYAWEDCLVDATYYAVGISGDETDSAGDESSSLAAVASADTGSYARAEVNTDTHNTDAIITAESMSVATGGGDTDARIQADAEDGSSDDMQLYAGAYASGPGSDAFSQITIEGSVQAGFYFDVDAENGAYAIAFMLSDGTSTVAYTYANAAGGIDALATILSKGGAPDVIAIVGVSIPR